MDEIERLAPGVRLADPDGIREYLLQYPELLDEILKAVDAARKRFPEAQLVLDVYRDEKNNKHLALYFRLRSYADFRQSEEDGR